MKNKQKEYDKFDGFISSIIQISCTNCDGESETDGDEFDAPEIFYEEGWRATSTNCYCPNCAKKKLKK